MKGYSEINGKKFLLIDHDSLIELSREREGRIAIKDVLEIRLTSYWNRKTWSNWEFNGIGTKIKGVFILHPCGTRQFINNSFYDI